MTRPGQSTRRRAGLQALAGEPPSGYSTLEQRDATADVESGQQIKRGTGGRAARRTSSGINLRAVADVLEGYGLDPVEKLAEIISATRPLLAQGKPVLDEAGKPIMVPVLDDELRARVLMDLTQYTRPKLKAMEVTIKPPEPTGEQLEMRLESLLAKAGIVPKSGTATPKSGTP
jgi:hypothetical protein